MDAVQMIGNAVLGIDREKVFVGGRVYVVKPPTIRTMCGAARYLGKVSKLEGVSDLIAALSDDSLPKALSWFIEGSETLAEELSRADVNELADALVRCLDMIDPQNFMRLSVLSRNVRNLIARQKS